MARGNFDRQVEGPQSAKSETSTKAPDGSTGFGSAQEILRDQEHAIAGGDEGVLRDQLLGDDRTNISILRSKFAELRAKATAADAKMAALGEPQELLTAIAGLAAQLRKLQTTGAMEAT